MGTAGISTLVYLAVHVKEMVSEAAELVEEVPPLSCGRFLPLK